MREEKKSKEKKRVEKRREKKGGNSRMKETRSQALETDTGNGSSRDQEKGIPAVTTSQRLFYFFINLSENFSQTPQGSSGRFSVLRRDPL